MRSFVCITGAASGLGKAFAAECAERGWDLLLTDINEPSLPPIAAGMERMHGVEVHYHAIDLTYAAARDAFWQFIQDKGFQLHMLFNVAGVEYEGLFRERSLPELCNIVRLNIEATMEMTRYALEYRDPCRPLHIINISSLASFYPMPVKAVYAASKRFLLDLSQALNQELRIENVTVTALCPAGLPTTHDSIEKINAQGLMGRITTLNVGDVAAKTINAALAGRPVFVPGGINQFLRLLGTLIPTTSVASFIGRRWRRVSKKILAASSLQPQTSTNAPLDV